MQQMINDFLRSQPQEGIPNYNLMGTIATVTMMAAVVFYVVRMRSRFITVLKTVAVAAIAFYFCVYAQHFFMWYRTGYASGAYYQTANIAVAFTALPLVSWLCAKTFNTSVGFADDVVALTLLGFHVVGRSGCIFGGCCYGFPCDWGWYSTDTKANQFPTAFVESLFTLAILVFLLVRICRKGYTPDGKNLPYFLLLYGVCRFFSEMTRESTRDWWLFWRISDVHFHMLVMAAVGGLLLWHRVKKESLDRVGEGVPLPVLKRRRR